MHGWFSLVFLYGINFMTSRRQGFHRENKVSLLVVAQRKVKKCEDQVSREIKTIELSTSKDHNSQKLRDRGKVYVMPYTHTDNNLHVPVLVLLSSTLVL